MLEWIEGKKDLGEWRVLALVCLLDLAMLLVCASFLSISYHEARAFFEREEAVIYLIRASTMIFGQNDFALRMPMIALHMASVVLLYNVSKFYLKNFSDRIIATLLFILLPGTIASALVVNNAGLVITLCLMILYALHTERKILFYLLLIGVFFVDGDFLVLYVAFFIYALARKDALLAWPCGCAVLASLYVFGFETGGRPSGHFLDTFGVFAAVFSPFVFIYFVYTIYRIWVKESKEPLWYVGVSAFCFCMIVSLRQRLDLENFLPFCIICVPLMVRMFFSAYRVRLPKFRVRYRAAGIFVIGFLAINSLLIVANPLLYKCIDEPKKHFAYKFNVAKELAQKLKDQGKDSALIPDKRLALRLKFYGISDGTEQVLLQTQNGSIVVKGGGESIARFELLGK